jgi:hypothetical protein
MTFRKLLMLGGIGGLVYAHRKRGGQMTLDSFKESGRTLLDSVKSRANDLRTQAESRINDVAGKVVDKTNQTTESVSQGGSFSDDVTGYGTSGYGYGTRR